MSDKNANLDEFNDSGLSKSNDSERLENKIEIIKGTKPDEVLGEPTENSEKYLVVDTLTGENKKYAIDENAPRAKPEDSIMIMDGSKSGRVYSGDSGILGSTMASLRPNGINPIFLRFFLESNFNRINSATKGSAVPHTDKGLVRSLEYKIASLSEQRKIATVLHTVDQAIQKTERVINHYNNIQTGLLREQFGKSSSRTDSSGRRVDKRLGPKTYYVPENWDIVQIMDIGEVVTGDTPSTKNEEYYGGKLPFVTPEDFGDTNRVYSGSRRLTNKGRQKARPVPEGAVMMDCIGMDMGKVRIAGREIATNQQINSVIVDTQKMIPEFLYFHLNAISNLIQSQAGQTRTPIVSKSQFSSFEIFNPSISTQREIVKSLTLFDELIERESEYAAQLRRLKSGLMQDLLSGAVRTTDANIDITEEVVKYG